MIPDVPPYATMPSILSACFVAGAHASFGQFLAKVYESNAHLSKYPMGLRASQVSRNAFNGLINADCLVYEHSSFALSASMQSVVDERVGLQALKDGGNYSAAAAGQTRSEVLEVRELRFCPACVRSDSDRYGFAHWRVGHQVILAHHCIDHRIALRSRCSKCGSAIEPKWGPHFAGDPCQRCGSGDFASLAYEEPPAYWPLMNLMRQALRSQAPGLRPARRALALSRIASADPRHEGATRVTMRSFLDSWNVHSLSELSSLWGGSPKALSLALYSHAATLQPAEEVNVEESSGDDAADRVDQKGFGSSPLEAVEARLHSAMVCELLNRR